MLANEAFTARAPEQVVRVVQVCNELNVATAAGQPTAVQLECTDSAATLTYVIGPPVRLTT